MENGEKRILGVGLLVAEKVAKREEQKKKRSWAKGGGNGSSDRDVLSASNGPRRRHVALPVVVKIRWGLLHRVSNGRGLRDRPPDQSQKKALSNRTTMPRVIHSSVILSCDQHNTPTVPNRAISKNEPCISRYKRTMQKLKMQRRILLH